MMEKVNRTDRELFRRALTEAFIRKFDRELEDCPFDGTCSDQHVRAMEAIVADGIKAEQIKKRKTWIVALLVAAAVLMTACTVYAYRGEIRDFIEKVYEERIRVTYYDADEEPKADIITEFYTLGYVPKGYVLESENCLPVMSKIKWVNEQGDYIILEQHLLDGSNYSMDTENGQTSVIICGEFEVYCLNAEVSNYMWNDGIYAYKIRSSEIISDDELAQIISGLQISK